MALSRVFTFADGEVILASKINAEYNQLVNVLNGTYTTEPISVKHSNAANPTLTLDHTAGGKLLVVRVNGVAKAEVSATGQFVSLLATGTAPLVVASTTSVANLNADLVDGKHADDLLAAVAPVVKHNGGSGTLDVQHTSGHLVRITNEATLFKLRNVTAGTDLLVVDKSTRRATFGEQVVIGASAPTAVDHAARKDYVDGRKTRWLYAAYWRGISQTGERQPSFIIPNGAVVSLTHLHALHRGGTTPSGPSILRLERYAANGTLLATHDITLPQAQAANVPVTLAVGPVTLAAGEHITFKLQSYGNHVDISASASGTQTVGS